MRLSIRLRLFLTLLLASALAVAGMLGFMRWSIERGFVELVEAREQARLEALSARLVTEFERAGWDRLRYERRAWLRVLFEREPGDGRPPRRTPRWMRDGPADAGWPPPERAGARPAGSRPGRPLELRVMLLDASGAIVRGRAELLGEARRVPIEVGGRTAGYLAVLPGPALSELGELRVLERQRAALGGVAVATTVLSGILALIFSAWLARPLRGFQETVQALAAGDYAARAAVRGSDDIGRLAADLNALGEALARHEHDRRQWVADISHELRTPLSVLRAEIEAIQDGVRELEPQVVDGLHADVLRLARLVDDLYELSTTDLGALSFRRSPMDALVPLRAAVDAQARRVAAGGLSIDLLVEPGAEPARVDGDADRLAQLFANLLANAVSYTDPGGRIVVRAGIAGQCLEVKVEDSAPAVPDEALGRLFERLYRVDASRTRNSGGAGLGLAICANIVAAHGGSVHAEHSQLGGLAVTVSLPLAR